MHKEHAHISRRVGTVSFFTFISRVLGLARDMVLAWAFGATRVADAFYVAFRIPNLLRRLVAEGALTVAFIPVFTEHLKRSREDGRSAASVVFTYLSVFLVIITVLGVLFAPWIVKAVAWGFQDISEEKFELTVFLTRIMFPYIFLISLVALSMGILNSLKRFAAPAASPILLNLGIITGALVLDKFFDVPAEGLAIGVIIGGIAQLMLQIPFLAKEGMLPRVDFNWKHPALRGLLGLMIPAAFGAAVYQFNVLIITFLASFLPDGSVSYLWYADRISEFSLGIFSIAVATAVLPTLSDHAANKDIASLKNTMNFGLRLALLIDIPAMIALYILALPIVRVLFERGEFTDSTAIATAGALSFFALKIPFVSGARNLVPGFFALRDARTPVYAAAVAVIVNGAVAYLLMRTMAYRGLALALVISSAVNLGILLIMFRRKVGPIGMGKIISSAGRTAFAAVIMGAVLLAAKHHVEILPTWSVWLKVVSLLGFVVGGAAIYLSMIRIVSAEEFKALMHLIRRRKTPSELSPDKTV